MLDHLPLVDRAELLFAESPNRVRELDRRCSYVSHAAAGSSRSQADAVSLLENGALKMAIRAKQTMRSAFRYDLTTVYWRQSIEILVLRLMMSNIIRRQRINGETRDRLLRNQAIITVTARELIY